MLGSRREKELMDGREIVYRTSSWGRSLSDVLAEISEAVKSSPHHVDELMIGYWEYGDEIVITAPKK